MAKKLDQATEQHLREVAGIIASHSGAPAPAQQHAIDAAIGAIAEVGSPFDAVSQAFAATQPATDDLSARLQRDFATAGRLFEETMAQAFGAAPSAAAAPGAPPKKPTLISSFREGFNARSQPLEEVARQAAGLTGISKPQAFRHRAAKAAGKISAWIVDPAAMARRRDLKAKVKALD